MMKENDPIKDVRRWKRGDPLKAKRFNEGVDAINRISGGIKPPRQIAAGGRSVSTSTSSKIQQFKVVSASTDFLVCVPYDSLISYTTNIVLVAKPYLLRQTPFNGKTRDGVTYTYSDGATRTATDGTDEETQLITPSYIADDIIYAVRNIAGKTDVYNTQSVIIEWLDINADGRAWAKDTSA